MNDIVIRAATIKDAESIAKSHLQSWRETYTGIISDEYLDAINLEQRVKKWEENLEQRHEDCDTIIALGKDENVIGFVSGGKARKDIGYDGEMRAIYILKKYQKQNLGILLTQELVKKLHERGFKKMYVGVLKENPSRGFYMKYGAKYLFSEDIEIGGMTYEEEFYGWDSLDIF